MNYCSGLDFFMGLSGVVGWFSAIGVFLRFRQFFLVRFLSMSLWYGVSGVLKNRQFPHFSALFLHFSASCC